MEISQMDIDMPDIKTLIEKKKKKWFNAIKYGY